MGHQIEPNAAPIYDFCYTKNLKYSPSPIIRIQLRGGRKGAWLGSSEFGNSAYVSKVKIAFWHHCALPKGGNQLACCTLNGAMAS